MAETSIQRAFRELSETLYNSESLHPINANPLDRERISRAMHNMHVAVHETVKATVPVIPKQPQEARWPHRDRGPCPAGQVMGRRGCRELGQYDG